MKYEVLANTYEQLESTTKRLEMIDILVELFKKTPTDILDKVIFLTQGKLYPSWEDKPVIGIAEKLAIKTISNVADTPSKVVTQKIKEIGDLGTTFEKLKPKRKQKPLFTTPVTVERVYKTLYSIAQASGERTNVSKARDLAGLLIDASIKEAKWIFRTVIGKLRFGIAAQSMLDALALAFTGNKDNKPAIERAYNIHPNLGEIAKTLAQDGLNTLEKMKITVFTPVRMMLAQRLSSIEEILEKLGGKCASEYKYDGERIQAHRSGEQVRLFTRNLEDPTSQYPDVCALIRTLQMESGVVEGECVAINPETGDLRPFQELMQRRRKYGIEQMIEKVPVCLFLFDILKKDEQDLITEPYSLRRRILEEIVQETDRLKLATALVSDSSSEIEEFFISGIETGCEGIIAKSINDDSIYQAGARGWLWI